MKLLIALLGALATSFLVGSNFSYTGETFFLLESLLAVVTLSITISLIMFMRGGKVKFSSMLVWVLALFLGIWILVFFGLFYGVVTALISWPLFSYMHILVMRKTFEFNNIRVAERIGPLIAFLSFFTIYLEYEYVLFVVIFCVSCSVTVPAVLIKSKNI